MQLRACVCKAICSYHETIKHIVLVMQIKNSLLSVSVEVCRQRVILLCIRGKVMDTSVATEGGPLRNHPQSATYFIYTRKGCCTFPLNLITDTLFSPFLYFYLSILYWGEYTQNYFPKRKRSNRHRQVYCIGCGPSHFCSKSNEISQMTQAIQICETISYGRDSASLFYRRVSFVRTFGVQVAS